MDKQNIQHTIKIDDFMTVNLNIPKELDAIELNGLLMKAKKLMSVSVGDLPVKKHITRSSNKFTEQQNNEMIHDIKTSHKSVFDLAQKYSKKYKIDFAIARNKIKNLKYIYKV